MHHQNTKKNDHENSTYKRIINNIEDYLENKDNTIHIAIIVKNNFEYNYNKLKEKINNLKISLMRDSYSPKRWIEVSGLNVSKYNGIKYISDIEKIDNNNIIAFGDSLNDIDMLEKSAVSVAVSNAIEEVKEAAKYITKSYNEDGVIEFLKWYL